jgi:hypothetical protein
VARGLGLGAITGSLESRSRKEFVTLLRFSPAGDLTSQVSTEIDDPAKEKDRVDNLARLLLGESPAVGITPEPSSGLKDRDLSARELEARRLDLLPIPGASSIKVYHRPIPAAVSGASVVALTAAGVVLVGASPLEVPWTYEERAWRDGAVLTGVGVAGYLTTTWLSNLILRRINERHVAP